MVCGAPEGRANPHPPPSVAPKSRRGPPRTPPGKIRPQGRPLCAAGGRGHSAHGAQHIEAFNGMGRGLPHQRTQKHGPLCTPWDTQSTAVTLVLGSGVCCGGLDKTPFLTGGFLGPLQLRVKVFLDAPRPCAYHTCSAQHNAHGVHTRHTERWCLPPPT